MRIAISPDENPGDPGTTADPTITERDLNLKVAAALQAELERSGQTVSFDPSITYVDRVQRANNDGTDLLIACAHNAGGGQGLRALVCPGGHQSEKATWSDGRPNRQDDLAKAVAAELEAAQLVDQWSIVDENVFECCQFQFDTGYFELEFMDSAHDQAIYRQPGYPVAAAAAIARGVAQVYGFTYVPAAAPAPAPVPTPAPEPPPASSPAAAATSGTAFGPTTADSFAAGFFRGKPGQYPARDVFVACAADTALGGPFPVELAVYFVPRDWTPTGPGAEQHSVELEASQQVTVACGLQGEVSVRIQHLSGGPYVARVYEEFLP